MDSTRLVNDLIAITSRLIVLMTAEIDLLRASNVKKAEGLQSEKASLARAYETLIRELKKHPETMRDVAPVLRDELIDKARDFQRLLLRNEAALRAARDTNQRVLKAVADAVTDSRKASSPYSRPGQAGAAKAHEPPVSVTIDKTF
jgi:flagellar biosynthesis/type III secretory pathway chaperone